MTIFITQFDYDRLIKLLDKKKPHDEYDKTLLNELERSKLVDPKNIPTDVVTMNSQVRFKDNDGDEWEYWLVFPNDANISKQRISILSPVGCALIGCRKGDTVTLPTPKGHKELKIEDILHQPEREGKFDL